MAFVVYKVRNILFGSGVAEPPASSGFGVASFGTSPFGG